MNIDSSQLDHWRAYLEQVRTTSIDALEQLAAGRSGRVRELLGFTRDSAARMGKKLEDAGARRPDDLPPPPEVPLHLLMSPANQRFLDQLRQTIEYARAVDRERGYADGTGPNEGIIGMVLANVELEIGGPQSPMGE